MNAIDPTLEQLLELTRALGDPALDYAILGEGNTSVAAEGETFYVKYKGAFTERSKNKLANLYDGTSNTFLFGETLAGSQIGVRDFSAAWMGACNFPTAWCLISAVRSWPCTRRRPSPWRTRRLRRSCRTR